MAEFPRNARGQTYGSMADVPYGGEPDLIRAVAVSGVEGYVARTDLMPPEPEPRSPREALVRQHAAYLAGDRHIPVYAEDGTTVVGEFVVGAPGPGHVLRPGQDPGEHLAAGRPVMRSAGQPPAQPSP